MRKRCLALVTLMVMLASMVLPCAAMAEGRDGYVFYAPVGTIIMTPIWCCPWSIVYQTENAEVAAVAYLTI